MKATTGKCALGIITLLVALLAYWQATSADKKIDQGESHSLNAPSISPWSKTFGGTLNDRFNSIAPTNDGGSIAVGYTESFSATRDIWVVKLDGDGVSTWQKTLGGGSTDTGSSVAPTNDGGYIVAGRTKSFGAGNRDVWLLKLDNLGNITWQKTFGGIGEEGNPRIIPTTDGGYIFAADTASSGAGLTDIWVVKLDSSGNITWQKTYGGTGDDLRGTIIPTSDNGYVVTGSLAGVAWLIKLDSSGTATWQKTYSVAGVNQSQITSLVQTGDEGYIAGGSTAQFGAGANDAWVLKLDSLGNVTWQKTYGGAGDEFVSAILATSDGGYIFSADTTSFGTNKALLVKLDSVGTVTWQKFYGGSVYDSPNPILSTSDGGYLVIGYTQSFGAGGEDGWVFKVDGNGDLAGTCPPLSISSVTANNSSATAGDSTIIPNTSAVSPIGSGATPVNTFITPGSTSRCILHLPLVLR
ncbi:MAG: hypothetical protein HZB51_33135 [Chloroflexi bacterium]|nr:hypothetical protein [Chloroflexota bacterium]